MKVFTPDYSIGESHFLFNTRALRRYCETKGYELEDLYLKVQKALTDTENYTDVLQGVKDFMLSDLADLLLFGNESWCVYNKQPFTADELQKDLWIDEMGGLVQQRNAFATVIITIAKRMLSDGEEKKSETQTVNNNALHGEGSLP